MAIFSNTMYVSEGMDQYGVEPTLEGSAKILYEFSSDVYKLISGMYVADVMIESAVSEGATNADILVEETKESFKTKMVNTFKKLATKIKEWFRKIITNIKAFFLGTDKFVKKYEKQIRENFSKMDGGVTAKEGYEFMSIDQMKSTHTEVTKPFVDGIQLGENDDPATKFDELLKGTKLGDVTDISSAKDALKKKLYGGEKQKDLKITNIDNVIKSVKTGGAVIQQIQGYEKTNIGVINEAIKLINSDNDDVTTKTTAFYSKCINAIQGFTSVVVDAINKSMKFNYALLKKVAAYKPAKESFNIFESALNVL